jgi:hypothetical protein
MNLVVCFTLKLILNSFGWYFFQVVVYGYVGGCCLINVGEYSYFVWLLCD